MSVMSLSDVWPREDRPLTVEDLLRLPDDGNRYELVGGVLEVSPPPLNPHNRVTHRLQVILEDHLPEGLEVLAGSGVNLANDHHRIPDIIVVRSDWVESTPFI